MPNWNVDADQADFDFLQEYQKRRNYGSRKEVLHDARLALEKLEGNAETTKILENTEEYRKEREDLEHSVESDSSKIRLPNLGSEQELFGCDFRGFFNSENFYCGASPHSDLKPMVRVKSDGSVSKKLCKLCQRLKSEDRFLNGNVLTKSGETYKELLRKRKYEERLEQKREIEAVHTEAVKERRAVHSPRTSRIEFPQNRNGEPIDFYPSQ